MSYRNEYRAQRAKAEVRGIPWELSYAEWLEIWQKSGHLPHRGRGYGKYAMARYGDTGPYKADNVKIIEAVDNTLEYCAARRYAAGARRLEGRRRRNLNFADGRLDMLEPPELLELIDDGIDKVL